MQHLTQSPISNESYVEQILSSAKILAFIFPTMLAKLLVIIGLNYPCFGEICCMCPNTVNVCIKTECGHIKERLLPPPQFYEGILKPLQLKY